MISLYKWQYFRKTEYVVKTLKVYYKKCKKDDCPVKEEKSMSEVYGLIRKLGATSKYKGYDYVAEAENMAK